MGGEKTGFRGFGGFGFAGIFSGQAAGADWIGVGLLAGLGFGFAFGFCLSGFGLGWVGTAGAAAEGTYVSFFSPDPNLVPEAQPYNEIYTAATGNEFGAFGGASAFTTYIGLQAIKVCADGGDLSRACVVDALTNINLESSPLGLPVAFGEGNQIAGSRFFLFQVKDGKFTLVQ